MDREIATNGLGLQVQPGLFHSGTKLKCKYTMPIINYPVLDFKPSFKSFLIYAKSYNKGKPLREQLRPQHAKMFARILILTSKQLYRRNKLFSDTPEFKRHDSSQPYNLRANRKKLSWVEEGIPINENTAYRQVNRLIAAGVIQEKINHGSQMNFELLINPDFLSINDLSNPDYKPSLKYLKTEKSGFQKGLHTNCPPISPILEKELSSNLNIVVDKVTPPTVGDNILKEQERALKKNFLKEHREIAPEFVKKPGNNEKEQAIGPAGSSKLQKFQKAAARWFFWYTIHMLFEGREINPAHLENTLAYVQQNYFANCYSIKDVERLKATYKWRIDKAKRSIERHKIEMKYVFPGAYLDLSKKGVNPKSGNLYMSFVNTASWPGKYQNLQKQKEQQIKQRGYTDALNKQILKVANNPTLEQFFSCEAFVKKNLPHRMGEFLNHFSTANALNYG